MAKRFMTIDFLRGLAIWLMVFLHTMMRWVDRQTVQDNMGDQKFFILFILVSAVFFGAWCGFFLLVSSIGNMISMQRGLAKGMSPWTLGLRQVIGGMILLVFANLTEGTIGYHGGFGELAKTGIDPEMFGAAFQNLFSVENNGMAFLAVVTAVFVNYTVLSIVLQKQKDTKPLLKYGLCVTYVVILSIVVISIFAVAEYGIPSEPANHSWSAALDRMRKRGFSSNETIHAVANCVIINGIVQAILAAILGTNKPQAMMITYAVLAVIILALTPLIWEVLYPIDPIGFGEGPIYEIWYKWILQAYDGGPEPLFPFLAEAFLGSIIGIWMTQEKPNRKFIKIGLWICIFVFWIGLIMTMIQAFSGDMSGLELLISDSWNINRFGNRGTDTYGFMWFWWFMCLTAAHTASVLLIIRLIEFRGRGHAFKRGTRYMRRFGLVAFTIYNFQYFDQPTVWLFSLIPGVGPYNYGSIKFNAVWIWPVLVVVFLVLQAILILWEKVDYVFSLEWIIAKLAGVFIPSKKDSGLKWWQTSRLNAQSSLIEVEPIHYVEAEEVEHDKNVDSILAFKLAILGFIFFPLSIASYAVLRTAKRTEQPNKKMKAAIIMSTIGMSITGAVTLFSMFFSMTSLGIPSPF